MLREPEPHLTRAGRYLVWVCAGVFVLVMLGVLIQACARQPRRVATAERPWGQGYETPTGYMEPDHSYFYYWLMTTAFRRDVQPSYHVYVPPAGYPTTFRPWHDDTPYRPKTAVTPARSTGGFDAQPVQPVRRERTTTTTIPRTTATTPARTTGGFDAPSAKTPARTTGGFDSQPAATAATPARSSGGFDAKPKATPSSARTSGGFPTKDPKKK